MLKNLQLFIKQNNIKTILIDSLSLMPQLKQLELNGKILYCIYNTDSELRIITKYWKQTPIKYDNENIEFDLLISEEYSTYNKFFQNNKFKYIYSNFNITYLNHNYIQFKEYSTIYKLINSNNSYYISALDLLYNTKQMIINLLDKQNLSQNIKNKILESSNLVKTFSSRLNNELNEASLYLKIPIMIRNYNRINYLRITLNSLLKTYLYNSEITIYDDCSTDEKTKEFLNTFNLINFKEFSLADQLDNIRDFNNIKLNEFQFGIKEKFNILINQENKGDVKGLFFGLKYMFNKYPDAPFIISLQNDLLFNKEWLTTLLSLYKRFSDDPKLGILTVFSHKHQIIAPFITGQCLLITRNFYNYLLSEGYIDKDYKSISAEEKNKFKGLMPKLEQYNCCNDNHLFYYAKLGNFKCYQTCQSYISHIGITSTCNNFVKPQLSINFQKNVAYDQHALSKKSYIQPKRILIFSNIDFPKQNCEKLNIKETDILVFLNKAIPLKYFKNYQNIIRFYRYSSENYFGINDYKDVATSYYFIDGPNMCMTQAEFELMKKNYSQSFYNNPEVISKNKESKIHKMRQGPTTGWVVQFLLKLWYPNSKIQLVNFFPTTDFSTTHFEGHDWKFENDYYNSHKEIKIYDTRLNNISINKKQFEVVYIVDNNQKYIDCCKKSIESLLKYNPNVHINIVSEIPININNYKNIILEDLKNKELRHNINDRISNAAYLKLILTKLPYDKILYIDCDTIIRKDLSELIDSNYEYIGATQSHSFGEKQAEALNHKKYFLSGLLLMNLKNLRKINFYEKALNAINNIKNINFKYYQHEQTILNYYFYDYIKQYSVKYNYCYNRLYKNPLKDSEIFIYHFPGSDKSAMKNF